MNDFHHLRSYSSHQYPHPQQYLTVGNKADRFPEQSYHKHHQYSFTTNQPNSSSSYRQKGLKMLNGVRKQLAEIEGSKAIQSRIKTQFNKNQSDIYLSPYSGQGIGSGFKQKYQNRESSSHDRWNNFMIRSPNYKQPYENHKASHFNPEGHEHRINMSFEYPKYEPVDPQKYRKVDIKVNITPKNYQYIPQRISTQPQVKPNYVQAFNSYRKSLIERQDKPSQEFKIKSRQSRYFQNNNNKFEDIIRKKCQIQDIIGQDYKSHELYCLKDQKGNQFPESKCLLKNKQKNIRDKPIQPKSKPSNSYHQHYLSKGEKISTNFVNKSDYPKQYRSNHINSSDKKFQIYKNGSKAKKQSKQHEKRLQKLISFAPTTNDKNTLKLRRQSHSKVNTKKNSCEKSICSRSKDKNINYPPSSPYYRKKIQSKQKRLSSEKINYNSNYGTKEVIKLKSQIKDLQSKINQQFNETLQAKKDINKSGQYTYFMNNFWDQIQNSNQSRSLSKSRQDSIKRHTKQNTQNSPKKVGFQQTNEESFYKKFTHISPIHSKNRSPSKTKFKQHLRKHFLVNHYLEDEDLEKVYRQVQHKNLPEQEWIIVALNEVYKKQHENPKPLY